MVKQLLNKIEQHVEKLIMIRLNDVKDFVEGVFNVSNILFCFHVRMIYINYCLNLIIRYYILHPMNLNKLLKTLKSEKSEKSQIVESHIKTNPQNPYNYFIPTHIDPSSENFHVKAQISKIRYFVLPNLPNLVNCIRGCPISIFNVLPYSGRRVKEIDLRKDKFPQYFQFLKPLLDKQIPTYNHILINDYPEKTGIMAHEDGPLYKPKVFVLSLNSYAVINFQRTIEEKEYQSRVLLQPNSIHIFEEQAYTDCLHGIQNFGYDSIFLSYCEEQRRVKKCSVSNFQQLKCKDLIQGAIQKWNGNEKYVEMKDICILKVEENEQYNWKVEFRRNERISITIRQKYQQ